MMASAVLAEGYVYDAVRGKVVGYGMGSPDSFRPESGRGEATIDDAYVDGVALARWTPGGRVHVATYAAGLSYFQRDFWYEIGGNCVCHAGINLAPDWLGEDYYCDSPMRGPPATCAFGAPWEPDGCRSFDECERANCTGGWANGVSIYGSSSSRCSTAPSARPSSSSSSARTRAAASRRSRVTGTSPI